MTLCRQPTPWASIGTSAIYATVCVRALCFILQPAGRTYGLQANVARLPGGAETATAAGECICSEAACRLRKTATLCRLSAYQRPAAVVQSYYKLHVGQPTSQQRLRILAIADRGDDGNHRCPDIRLLATSAARLWLRRLGVSAGLVPCCCCCGC